MNNSVEITIHCISLLLTIVNRPSCSVAALSTESCLLTCSCLSISMCECVYVCVCVCVWCMYVDSKRIESPLFQVRPTKRQISSHSEKRERRKPTHRESNPTFQHHKAWGRERVRERERRFNAKLVYLSGSVGGKPCNRITREVLTQTEHTPAMEVSGAVTIYVEQI